MPLRVLHVIESLTPHAGAVAVALPGLVAALRRDGIESTVLTADDESAGHWDTCDVHRFDPKGAGSMAEQADLVHFHGFGSRLSRETIAAARKARRVSVITPLGAMTPSRHRKSTRTRRIAAWFRDRMAVKQSGALIAANDREAGSLERQYRASRIECLSYGIDSDEYDAAPGATGGADKVGRTSDGQRPHGVLVLAPIHPIDGFVPVFKAFVELAMEFDSWRLIFAGPARGDYRKMLEAAIRRKGASDWITIAAADDVGAQRALLAQASLLVATSLHPRCPISILQAAASGVPVLASAVAVPAELADVVSVAEPTRAALKDALREAFTRSAGDARAMADGARAACRSRLDWRVLGPRFVNLYESLV